MKQKIFPVYDSKAGAFASPFFMPTLGMATRAFSDECNNPTSSLNKHSEDYTLFELGEFDDASGKLEVYSTPKSIGLAFDFLSCGQAG